MWLFTIHLFFPRIFPPSSRWTGSAIGSTFATYRSRSLSTTSTNLWKRFSLPDSVAYFIPTSITSSRVSVTWDLFCCVVCGITALDGQNETYSSGLHDFLSWNESLFLSWLSRTQISWLNGLFFPAPLVHHNSLLSISNGRWNGWK